jgi:TRAP-type mannitol/chloroaromatic compound transport system permease small subunit
VAAEVISRLSAWAGAIARAALLLMVLMGAYNAVARYVGRAVGIQLSSNAFIEAQWYLFSLVFLLGSAYALKRGDHVRVDVLYSRFGERGQAWVNLLGSLLLLLPFTLFGLVVSWPAVLHSWQLLEGSPDPGGLPRYPIKTFVLIGFALLFLQGLVGLRESYRQLRAAR